MPSVDLWSSSQNFVVSPAPQRLIYSSFGAQYPLGYVELEENDTELSFGQDNRLWLTLTRGQVVKHILVRDQGGKKGRASKIAGGQNI